MAMTHFPQIDVSRRAPRIPLTLPAVVIQENRQRAQCKLQTVSTNGGLLKVSKAIGAGSLVEVEFTTQSLSIRGMAEMLSPLRTTNDGVLQPFRFVALEDDAHQALISMANLQGDLGRWASTATKLY